MTTKGYRGSYTLKKSNTQIEWTPELLEELSKCSSDPIYFAENHMKIVNVDHGLITLPLYDYQSEIINTVHKERYTVAECARQSGKALPLDTAIPSPLGWTTMKDLKPGDKIFDEAGKETTVRSISKIFENHDCFRITFDDGSIVDADADHLWVVERSNRSKRQIKIKKLTTKELFHDTVSKTDSRGKLQSKWKIPVAKAVQYGNKEIRIDPYLLGLWLGDGESASGRITCHINDLEHYKKEFPAFEFSENHEKRNNSVYTGTVYGLSKELRSYNLLKNKHIPPDYLFNDIRTRQSVLQGLLDSDGTIEKSGRICLCLSYNKNPQLIEDAHELILSLGIKVQRKEYNKTNSVRLYFMCPKEKFVLFRLPRKNEKQKNSHVRAYKTEYRYIRKIEKIDSVPTKCIEVENDSHLFLCSKFFIPTHNTTALTAYVLWYILFNSTKTVAILANKGETAREILGRIQLAYENLPHWLQQGVVEWNKGSFELENGSRVLAGATTKASARGYSINLLIIDECAFVENWDFFWTSVYPTISSGQTTKVLLVSTVNGLNHFWKITSHARDKKNWNGFNLISVPWWRVPNRDEEWKRQTLAAMNFDEDKFRQEYENAYLGSSGTLIAGWKLEDLTNNWKTLPIQKQLGISMYKKPEKHKTYVGIADVSRGKGLDYSALQIIDISQMPYEQVLVFRDNMTTPADFAEIINRVGKQYNSCPILIEVNDIGAQTADTLYFDYEYENVLFTESAGRAGKRITLSYKGNGTDRGIRTTKTVKAVGCSMLKLLIEQNQLQIYDSDTIHELSTFSKKNNSYEAEPGNNDDLVMCLVLFGWLSEQVYFKDLTDINTLMKLKERTAEETENEMLPFGFISNGNSEAEEIVEKLELSKEENWTVVDDYSRWTV